MASWIGNEGGSVPPAAIVVQWVDGAGWIYQLRMVTPATARLVRLQRGRVPRKVLGTYIVAPVAGGLSRLAADLHRWQDGDVAGVPPALVIIDEEVH